MKVLLVSIAILAWMGAGSASAGSIPLEAEDFIASGNAGGARITVSTCADASGGLAVNGMDAPGDWIELAFTLSDAACFVDSLRSAGEVGIVRRFVVEFFAAAPPAADTLTTGPGRGFG